MFTIGKRSMLLKRSQQSTIKRLKISTFYRRRQKRAKAEQGIDLIGAVDREIDPRVGIESGERDPQGQSLLIGALGRRHADDVAELARGEEGPDLGDHEGGGGAGPEAEDHAAADVLDGPDGGKLFEVVLGEGGGD